MLPAPGNGAALPHTNGIVALLICYKGILERQGNEWIYLMTCQVHPVGVG